MFILLKTSSLSLSLSPLLLSLLLSPSLSQPQSLSSLRSLRRALQCRVILLLRLRIGCLPPLLSLSPPPLHPCFQVIFLGLSSSSFYFFSLQCPPRTLAGLLFLSSSSLGGLFEIEREKGKRVRRKDENEMREREGVCVCVCVRKSSRKQTFSSSGGASALVSTFEAEEEGEAEAEGEA